MNIKQGIVGLALVFVSAHSHALSKDNWDTFSDVTAYGLVATAAALPVYKGDWEGFWQAGFSIGAASGIGLIGKNTIDAERPDGSDNKSFPSNHTANAFASATTLHIRHGWQVGLPAYGVAALTGYARVEADKHYWKDVLAGAAIGMATGYFFTEQYDASVQLSPWVDSNSVGLNVSYTW